MKTLTCLILLGLAALVLIPVGLLLLGLVKQLLPIVVLVLFVIGIVRYLP